MMKPWRAITLFLLVVLLGALAEAADFRVESKVFVGSEKKPIAESVTLFHAGVVYDYLTEPPEVTIFDPVRERFILLDTARRLKTELATKTVTEAVDGLKRRAAESDHPRMRFLCDPAFQEETDTASGELVFKSPWVVYRVVGRKIDSSEITTQYREFSDWYAKLNALLRPGSQPPFPRLLVNEALAKRGQTPEKVHVTQIRKQGLLTKQTELRSEHRLLRDLSEMEQRRLVRTGEQMAAFRSVSFKEYESRAAPPKR